MVSFTTLSGTSAGRCIMDSRKHMSFSVAYLDTDTCCSPLSWFAVVPYSNTGAEGGLSELSKYEDITKKAIRQRDCRGFLDLHYHTLPEEHSSLTMYLCLTGTVIFLILIPISLPLPLFYHHHHHHQRRQHHQYHPNHHQQQQQQHHNRSDPFPHNALPLFQK